MIWCHFQVNDELTIRLDMNGAVTAFNLCNKDRRPLLPHHTIWQIHGHLNRTITYKKSSGMVSHMSFFVINNQNNLIIEHFKYLIYVIIYCYGKRNYYLIALNCTSCVILWCSCGKNLVCKNLVCKNLVFESFFHE